MGWQVATVLDKETNIAALLGWLPVWAWSTPEREASAKDLWEQWNKVWDPEPSLTLFNSPVGDDPAEALFTEIPTIELHHHRLTALRLFGIKDSPALREGFENLGYKFVPASDGPWLLFARPMSSLGDIPELELNAAAWKGRNDFYDAFFEAVGAPDRHGRNFDALVDSIETGAISKIEVPYRISIRNVRATSETVRNFLKEFANLVAEMNSRGCPVEMRIEE